MIEKVLPLEKKWLSPEEAMKYLGCGGHYILKLRDSGMIKYSRIGNKWWFDRESLDRYITSNLVVK